MSVFPSTYGSPTSTKNRGKSPQKGATGGTKTTVATGGRKPPAATFTSDHYRKRNDELEATSRVLAAKNHAIAKKLGVVETAFLEAKVATKDLRHQLAFVKHTAAQREMEQNQREMEQNQREMELIQEVSRLKSTQVPKATSKSKPPLPPSDQRMSSSSSPIVGGRTLVPQVVVSPTGDFQVLSDVTTSLKQSSADLTVLTSSKSSNGSKPKGQNRPLAPDAEGPLPVLDDEPPCDYSSSNRSSRSSRSSSNGTPLIFSDDPEIPSSKPQGSSKDADLSAISSSSSRQPLASRMNTPPRDTRKHNRLDPDKLSLQSPTLVGSIVLHLLTAF
jgi:hypothetical protein